MLPYIAVLAGACIVAWWLFRGLINTAVLMFEVPLAKPKKRMWATAVFTALFCALVIAAWFYAGGFLIPDSLNPRSGAMYGIMLVSAGIVIFSPLVVQLTMRCIPRRAVSVGLFVSLCFALVLHIVVHGLLRWKGY